MEITYQQAGVNINKGNQFVENIKPIAKSTHTQAVLQGIGNFAACIALPVKEYQEPILVTSTDGVGTKLKLAIQFGQYDTIGIDLVAMCVNDLLCQGAKPLCFLDYYASGHLDLTTAQAIVQGIATGCKIANMPLVGGETAELPGLYEDNHFDLAGFSVGIAEKANLLGQHRVQATDVLIALPSSGLHANGYSLVQVLLKNSNQDPADITIENEPLPSYLLRPTKIYCNSLQPLFDNCGLHALAHITGGGLLDNLPRILPNYINAIINNNSWRCPEIFHWIQQEGNLSKQELFRTFNCGIGMVLCVAKQEAQAICQQLISLGETPWVLGHVESSPQVKPSVILRSS